MSTDYKSTKKFQYTHFKPCHPPGATKYFVRIEAIRGVSVGTGGSASSLGSRLVEGRVSLAFLVLLVKTAFT